MTNWLPESRQEVSHTSVRGNLEQKHTTNVYVTDGAIPGFGLWRWDDWVERVAGGARGPAAKATSLALQDALVRRDGQGSVITAVEAWVSDPTASSMTIGVKGKHGAGLTSCLFSIATSLVVSLGSEAVFVVEDVDRFFRTDLAKVLPGQNDLILIVDDADEQNAHRPLRIASGSLRVCTIYSTSSRSYAGVMGALNSRGVGLDIELPEVPSTTDIAALQLLHGRTALSLSESHAIKRGNFRSVACILNGSITTRVVTQRLGEMRRSENTAVAAAAAYLLVATARDAPIPQALLRRALATEIPDEVRSWVQVRPYIGQRGRKGNLLWIEDRAAARSAEDAWREDNQLDSDSFEESLQQTAQALLSAMSVNSSAERTCLRKIWRQLPPAVQRNLAKTNVGVLRDLIDKEAHTELVFGWMPILKLAGIDGSQILDALKGAEVVRPNDGVSLILAMHALGSEEVAQNLATEVDASQMWSIQSWVQFVAMLEHVPSREASTLIQAAMPWMRAREDLGEILGKSNTCQLLLPLLAQFGSHTDRLRVQKESLGLIFTQPHITGHVLDLTSRCLMQKRSELALRVTQTAVTKYLVQDTQALAAFAEELEYLRNEEERGSLGTSTAEMVAKSLREATSKPSVQNLPRSALLSFAGTWDPANKSELISESAEFLQQTLTDVPITHVAILFAKTMRMMAYQGGPPEEYLTMGLTPFKYGGRPNSQVGVAAVYSLVAFATTRYSSYARLALRSLIRDDPGRAAESMENFLYQVAHLAPRSDLRMPKALANLDSNGYIARSLIESIKFMGDDQEVVLRSAVTKWRKVSYVQLNLTSELVRLGMQDYEPSLFRVADDASASSRHLAVTALAQVNLNAARESMRKLFLEYLQSGEGAHPSAVTRSATAMSEATEGNESDLYRLVARLMAVGPLR